jgi:hypothetical protein
LEEIILDLIKRKKSQKGLGKELTYYHQGKITGKRSIRIPKESRACTDTGEFQSTGLWSELKNIEIKDEHEVLSLDE